MANQSAGILLYRRKQKTLEVLLVHPGGPFWQKKDLGAWTIPKGEFTTEEPLAAAKREFEEETGKALTGNFTALTPIRQKAGKMIFAWAVEGDIDVNTISSNTFVIEWPPKSGKRKEFPEIDRANWFRVEEAMTRINPAQIAFITELEAML